MSTSDNPGRRARKRVQMLGHLAGTAARLFKSRGYESVTMEQIAAEADVAKRTLYNHFDTKEAVLAHWLEAELERDLAHLQAGMAKRTTFVSRVTYLLNASADWCAEHPVYLTAYLRHRFLSIGITEADGSSASGSGIALAWQQLIAEGQRAGELRKTFPAEQLATWFHHLYLAALLRWMTVSGLSLRKEFAAIIKLFVEGAGARTRT
jgi:TetR/AcrR family transcriptional regulator, regulator of autoinduction and epiphytic fitness